MRFSFKSAQSWIVRNKKIILIIIVALLIRSSFLYLFHDMNYMASATSTYGLMGKNLLEGKLFVTDTESLEMINDAQSRTGKLVDLADLDITESGEDEPFSSMPGYSVLLYLTWLVFPQRYIYLQVVQVLLGLLCLALVYLMAKRAFGENTALLSALIYAAFIPVIIIEIAAYRDIYPLYAAVFSVYILFEVFTRNPASKYRSYILLGALIGLLAWVREIILVLPVFLAAAVLYKYGPKEFLKFLLTVYVTILLVFSPWIARNFMVFGEFMPGGSTMWHGMYTGFGEYPNSYNITFDDGATYRRVVDEWGYNVSYLSYEYNEILREKSMEIILGDPLWYSSIVMDRFARGMVMYAGHGTLFGPLMSLGKYVLVVFSLLSLAGIVISRKMVRKDYWMLLILVLLYFPIVYAPFNMGIRHVLVVSWVYMIFFSFLLVFIWGKLKKDTSSKSAC